MGTATTTLMSVEEYLNTAYRPDRDYVAGEVRERNMVEEAHSEIQGILTRIFGNHRYDWRVRVLPETRVQTLPDHFRIPDLCIVEASNARGRIVQYGPLLCIEVLSPSDRISEIQDRIDEYFDLGARAAWVVDPIKRIGYHASKQGFVQPADGVLRVEDTAIEVRLADLFAELDEQW